MASHITHESADKSLTGSGVYSPLPVTTSVMGVSVEKTVAFDGEAGNGATGTVDLYTVTGDVLVKLYAVCTEDLAGATATIEVGTAGDTAAIIAQTTATNIDDGEIWHDATPDATVEASSVASEFIVADGADIIITIGSADITDGTLRFNLKWMPLSSEASVVAA